MSTTPETVARVRSKLSWGLEHKITPMLDTSEMEVVLSEFKRLQAYDEDKAKQAKPAAMDASPVVEEEIKPKTILRKGL